MHYARFIYLVNSMNKKRAPETPKATIKPFQKSDKKSPFICLLVGQEVLIKMFENLMKGVI